MASHIPYTQRQAWSDVTPLPQVEPADGLVPIMYSNEYSDAMSYFRAIATSGEKSERVVDLTEHIIRMNPAHYTVWQYRLAALIELDYDLVQELALMDSFAQENLKSYQVWHHRLSLISHLNPSIEQLQKEIDFIHTSLLPDCKNYHTWSYLHWIYTRFSSLPQDKGGDRFSDTHWAQELDWCERMLASNEVVGQDDMGGDVKGDGRNNSAWGWRWYLTVSRQGVRGKVNVERELQYTVTQIKAIPHNASAWNYLRGLCKELSIPFSQPLSSISHLAHSQPSSSSSTTPVPFAVEWLADAQVEKGTAESLDQAAKYFDDLATKWDVMRKTYWTYRKSVVVKQAKRAQSQLGGSSAADRSHPSSVSVGA